MVLTRVVAVVATSALLAGSAATPSQAWGAPSVGPRLLPTVAQGLDLDLEDLGLDQPEIISGSDTATVQRAAGTGRVATSVAASADFRDTAETALLATADGFADALAATALAARLDAPLLLTRRDELPEAVAHELSRLEAEDVILLGGTGAIGQPVTAELGELGYGITRVSGPHRFATAAEVARAVGASQDGEVLLALGSHPEAGRAWPDAVASSALAATGGNPPTLLTAHDQLPPATRRALSDLEATRVVIVGGTAAVSTDVAAEVESMGLATRRLAGASRYGTSRAVAEVALSRRSAESQPLVLATGEDYPDALAAGALADAVGGTVALTPSDRLAQPIDAFVRAHNDQLGRGVVVGGQSAASGAVVAQLEAALNGEPRPEGGDGSAPEGQPDADGGSSSELAPTPAPDEGSSRESGSSDGSSSADSGAGDGSPGSESESGSPPESGSESGSGSPPESGSESGSGSDGDEPASGDDPQVLATFEEPASWYGARFHGQQTACGDVFNMHELTAAHRQLPCGTRVRVTNLDNGLQVTVRINDHGPHVSGRVLDLSRAAASAIGLRAEGTARVRGEVLAE